MWEDNTNGLSSTGLLRPTDSSSAIRRNHNYNYILDVIYARFERHGKSILKMQIIANKLPSTNLE